MAESDTELAGAPVRSAGARLLGRAGELRSRVVSGMSQLKAQAGRGAARSAARVRDAAQDLRRPVMQHALAARERGNLEAAFWLLAEEFESRPEDAETALHYWDVALSLGRVQIASRAGAQLVEMRAAAGEPELAAQLWIELIKEAPDVLVSPAAIAVILPALRARLDSAQNDGPDDQETFRGFLRRAVRHAVDPRNSALHPGVALRIFEQGRDLNPEAARRAAEAALESPNLHEAKRERLTAWLAGESIASAPAETAPTRCEAVDVGSAAEIAASAARLPPSRPPPAARPAAKASGPGAKPKPAARPAPKPPPRAAAGTVKAAPAAPAGSAQRDAAASAAETISAPEPAAVAEPIDLSPSIVAATLEQLGDDGLTVSTGGQQREVPYADIQALSVAEVMGIEDGAVTLVDLVMNWSRRRREGLRVLRLRREEIDAAALVPSSPDVASDFSNLLGEILMRSQAIPLPDPESALGTRITCFHDLEMYEQTVLRIGG